MQKRVLLKRGKEESLLRFHPWIFSGAIASIEGTPDEGDVVDVYTYDGNWIAAGHIQVGSIAVRVLTFTQEPIDKAFWQKKIAIAYKLRSDLGLTNRADHNIYRLIHGEGDNLPGLVVDVYGRTAVVQAHSVGMHCNRMDIAQAIVDVLGDKILSVYYNIAI